VAGLDRAGPRERQAVDAGVDHLLPARVGIAARRPVEVAADQPDQDLLLRRLHVTV
jgi:hypothetical protein